MRWLARSAVIHMQRRRRPGPGAVRSREFQRVRALRLLRELRGSWQTARGRRPVGPLLEARWAEAGLVVVAAEWSEPGLEGAPGS